MTSDSLPVGTIVMWGGTGNVPGGWLLCDGTVYLQAQYKELYAAIGHNFGSPSQSGAFDPSKDFFVPDFRGRFIRGVDDTVDGSRDPDRANRCDMQSGDVIGQQVGSIQDDEFRAHSHPYTSFPNGRGKIASGRYWEQGAAMTGSTGGKETRPINAYIYFIIKAVSSENGHA